MEGWGGGPRGKIGCGAVKNPLFLLLGLGVSPVRSGLLGTLSLGTQKCGCDPVRSQWPTQTSPRPSTDLCWHVLNPKAALACLQLPSLSGCASSLSTWCLWPRLSCKALSSSAILLWTLCQRWVGARSWLLPQVPLIACLSKSWLWGDAPLCLVPFAVAIRMLGDISPGGWVFSSGYGIGGSASSPGQA